MSCEHTLQASLLLDGELPASDTAATVEHLLGCADCRELFRRGRALDAALLFAAAEESPAGDAGPAPAEVWERIGAEVGQQLRPQAVAELRRRRPRPAWLMPVAATLLVALGATAGWLARSGAPQPTDLLAQPTRSGNYATVSTTGTPAPPGTAPAGPGAEMSEERFVAIARELLAADSRFRDAMAGVLVVADSAEPREGSTAESSWRQEELQDLQPEAGGRERSRPDGARLY